MKGRISVITRKGQVTIPAEIRRALALGEGDKVTFELDGDHIKVARSTSIVARTAGALKSNAPQLTAEQEREDTEQAMAEDVAQRMSV